MGLRTLVGDWAERQQSLAAAHVIVVDDEPVVCEVLSELLGDEGFQVHVAGSAEIAWELIVANEYELVITDKNLPGDSGIDLIKRISAAKIDVPVVLITGHASLRSVNAALASGAADYISKPFDDVEVLTRRLRLIAERNQSRRICKEIIKDLASVVQRGDRGKERVIDIQNSHRAFHASLAERPEVLICNVDSTRVVAGVLQSSGLRVAIANDRQHAPAILSAPDGPLTALLDLDIGDSLAAAKAIKAADPFVEILVTTQSDNLRLALDVVTAGASDFVFLESEGVGAVAARMRRLVERSSRRRRHAQLLAELYAAARQVDLDISDTLLSLLPAGDRERITQGAEDG